MVENVRGFRGLASNREGFPANFFFFIIRCFELPYNHESFPVNNNKIMQPRKFSTANDLHYTVFLFRFAPIMAAFYSLLFYFSGKIDAPCTCDVCGKIMLTLYTLMKKVKFANL